MLNKELDSLSSVTPESLPGDGDDNHEEPLEGQEPEAEGQEPEESGDDPKDPKGRTIDNVRGELVRKLEAVTDQLNNVASRVDAILNSQSRQPQPTGGTTHVLDQYTVDQLQTALTSKDFDDATKQAIQTYLPGRIARDESRKVLEGLNANQQKAHAHQEAVNSYPELRNRTSPIYAETLRVINSRGGDAYTEKNPTALLDAANEAARNLGISPRGKVRATVRRSNRQDVDPSVRGGDRPTRPAKEESKGLLSAAEREKIERKLGPLLGKDKDGKPKKFTKKFIEEREAHYGKLFRGGR